MTTLLKYTSISLFIFMALTSMAQPVSKRDKIEALRVSFISQKVNLTTQETQLFWPLYNEYNDKLDLIKKTFRQQYIKNTDYTNASEKEAENYLNAELNLKQKELDLYKDYFEKFKKVIPLKKLALIHRAEEEFKKELIKNIKGNATE